MKNDDSLSFFMTSMVLCILGILGLLFIIWYTADSWMGYDESTIFSQRRVGQ